MLTVWLGLTAARDARDTEKGSITVGLASAVVAQPTSRRPAA